MGDIDYVVQRLQHRIVIVIPHFYLLPIPNVKRLIYRYIGVNLGRGLAARLSVALEAEAELPEKKEKFYPFQDRHVGPLCLFYHRLTSLRYFADKKL